MNIIDDKITTFHWFQIILISIFFSVNQKVFVTSSALSITMTSILFLLEYIRRSSSLYIEEIKLFANVNWISQVSDILRLFIMSFQYGLMFKDILQLILFCFYYCYFRIQYNCYSKNYLLLQVYNTFLFFLHAKNYC